MYKKVIKIIHYSATIHYTIESKSKLKTKNWMIQPELSLDEKTLSFFLPKDCVHSRMYFHEYMEYDLHEDKGKKFDFPDVVVKHKRMGNTRRPI